MQFVSFAFKIYILSGLVYIGLFLDCIRRSFLAIDIGSLSDYFSLSPSSNSLGYDS